LSPAERRVAGGAEPALLDVVEVSVTQHRPHAYQTENWLTAPTQWTRVSQMNASLLRRIVDSPSSLWVDGHSTAAGFNDRMPLAIANAESSSLSLVHVVDLELRVSAPGVAFGNPKRRVQAWFNYRDTQYGIWVTDPIIEVQYLAKPDGSYRLGARYLTLSLGEPYNDQVYKLVAAVFP
jgi:hypothetical protein